MHLFDKVCSKGRSRSLDGKSSFRERIFAEADEDEEEEDNKEEEPKKETMR